jgi:hypothetical protein
MQDVHIALNLTISLNGLTILVPIVSDQWLLIYVDDQLIYLVHYLIVVLNDNDLMLKIQSSWLYLNLYSIEYLLEFVEYDTNHYKDLLIVQLIPDHLDEYVSKKYQKFRSNFSITIDLHWHAHANNPSNWYINVHIPDWGYFLKIEYKYVLIVLEFVSLMTMYYWHFVFHFRTFLFSIKSSYHFHL